MSAWSINNRIRTPLLLMAGVETVILFSSVFVAGIIVFGTLEECRRILGPLGPRAAIVAAVIMTSLIAMGLYQFHQRFYFREAVVRVIAGLVAGCLTLAVVFYAFPSVIMTREISAIAVGYAMILLLIVRYLFMRTVDENIFRYRTLIYGDGKRATSIRKLRRRADRRGFKIVGTIAAPGDEIASGQEAMLAPGQSIADFALERGADEIVVAMDDRRGNLPIRDLLDAKVRGIDVVDILEFLERETGKIRIDLINPGWLIFAPGFRASRLRKFNKRLVDLIVSGALTAITWPIMLLIALAIKIEDGITAPVLYQQPRIGRNNEPFPLLKFRSMCVDAEPDGKAVWAVENDSRVTRVGALLRKCRLDELPQIFNVFGGQMSLVGPRPERSVFVENLTEVIPYYTERHTVKPGVTGWAQLRYSYGASEEDAVEKLQYDLYYVKNQSLLLDLIIILQTVEVVLWGKGAR